MVLPQTDTVDKSKDPKDSAKVLSGVPGLAFQSAPVIEIPFQKSTFVRPFVLLFFFFLNQLSSKKRGKNALSLVVGAHERAGTKQKA